MVFLSSITDRNFRRNFLVFFALASTLPLLLAIFVTYHYVLPLLYPQQIDGLQMTFTYGIVAMFLPSALGFLLMIHWVGVFETFTKEITSRSAEISGNLVENPEENELVALQDTFNELYNELQNKMDLLSQHSRKLMDTNVKLSGLANIDKLTQLYNRRFFDTSLMEETSNAEKHKKDLSLVLIDLDNFKTYNDNFGHPTGDKLLKEISALIKSNIRNNDMAFRYGGDEFAILLPGCNINIATQIADKLVKHVARHHFRATDDSDLGPITISCGVSAHPEGQKGLLDMADDCLLAAKRAGKGLVMATA